MRLESLKIRGFKSFAEKVELAFKPGITAIIGPNGCGKSNITDAIRWVLGEQSAKSLRGGQMEDVIFNGSSSCKPLGVAEVSLALTNLGSLPVPYQEVVICRKLFRSGEAEYSINKNPCRLKDIVELFLDTGLGKGAYSIIEQGKIDSLIVAKPKERRFLIESAAGIMKYKARKEESLKKMEATSQNLERLEDILREVEKQKDNLSKQAERAAVYKGYRGQEDSLMMKIASGQYSLLWRRKQEREQELARWQDRQMAIQADMNRNESELEGLKTGLIEDERQISSLQKTIFAIENKITTFSQLQQSSGREKERLQGEESSIKMELEELSKAQDQIEVDVKLTEEAIVEKERILLEGHENLDLLQGKWSLIQKEIEEKRKAFEIHRKDGLGLSNQEIRYKHLCETMRERQKDLRSRQRGLDGVLHRLEEDLQKKKENQNNLQDRVDQQKSVLEEARCQLMALGEKIKRTSEDLKHVETKVQELNKQLRTQTSRLHSLEEIFQRKEGYQESVRYLLTANKESRKEFSGLKGVIAELITAPPEYEKAIEAVLEHHVQDMVVNTWQESLALLQCIQERKIGRGTFLVMEMASSASDMVREVDVTSLNIPGVIGQVLHMIQYSNEYAGIMEYLFGNTVLVKDITCAKEVMDKLAGWCKLVTEHGEVLTSYGMVSGGSSQISPGLLAQKRKIEELRASIFQLEEEAGREESAQKQIINQIEVWKGDRESFRQKSHHIEILLNGLQKDLFHLQREIERDQQRIEELTYKRLRAEADEEELIKDLKAHEQLLNNVIAEKSKLEQMVETLSRELSSLEQQEKDVQGSMTQSKVDLASLEEHQKSLRKSLDRYQESRRQGMRRLETLQKKLEGVIFSQKENEKKLVEAQGHIPHLVQEKASSAAELQKAEALRSDKADEVKGIERKLKRSQQEYNQVTARVQEVEISLTEIKVQMDQILANRCLSEDQLPPQGTDSSMDEAQIQEAEEELRRVKEKLASFGAVNLLAIEEYNQLLERYEFLGNQKEDMIHSLNSLNSLINKINQDSRARFRQTFEEVNANFQFIFKKLFNGGHAELFLEQPEDLLETGIEIIIQPPGKRPQILSLLSGGERAMTAIALIFSIYLLKPSPFCLLDEIDAPLDEANTDRFISLLNEFKQKTQFLLITHSKKTMQMADVIYGITMEQPGLSKVISLELNKCSI
ncbi:MAG: chromosome segregation protein SMC [bacterium]